MGGQADPLGDVQEIEIWPYEQMVYAQPSTCPGEWDILTPMEVWHKNGSPNLGQKTTPYSNQLVKENLQNCRFCCPCWQQNKTEKSEKKDKYLDLASKLKKAMEDEGED